MILLESPKPMAVHRPLQAIESKVKYSITLQSKMIIFHKRTPHKMNGKVLSVKSSETLGFASSKRVEQMPQWAQRPAMDRFRDIRAGSDENYIVNILYTLYYPYHLKIFP